MTGSVGLLVVCLDGADWTWFDHHGGDQAFPVIARSSPYRQPLTTTVIPQTPVAWTTFLAGAEPSETGIWGWYVVDESDVRPVVTHDLPLAAFEWFDVPTLVAGLPFLDDAVIGHSRTLRGLGGPTSTPGGSRAVVPAKGSTSEQVLAWRAHHDGWVRTVCSAALDHGAEIVVAHCDVIDWFGHRHGPAAPVTAEAWLLADRLLGDLQAALGPETTVVVSDHGSAEVTRFIRIHEALRRAGLSTLGPADVGGDLAGFCGERVRCVSDYGALWCKDGALLDEATDLLRELGASQVVRPSGHRAPALVPVFPDGWLALVPPALDPGGDKLAITEGPVFEHLRSHNWRGDHARLGLVGCNDGRLWELLSSASLAGMKAGIGRFIQERRPSLAVD